MAMDGSSPLVSHLAFEPLLRASHIRPWRDASNQQRLDSQNGLLLRADLDVLFDRGYISFDDSGALLRSSALGEAILGALLGAVDAVRLADAVMTPSRRTYLAHHRERVFLR
jgi:putative restriction endonuclease